MVGLAGSPRMPASPSVSPATAPVAPRTTTSTTQPITARAITPATTPPVVARTATPSSTPPLNIQRTLSPRASIADIAKLVATRTQLIDQGADFFALLGLANDAPHEAVRVAHLRLASLLQPVQLALIGYDDSDGAAKRLLEQVEAAFNVLNDPARRAAYLATLSRTVTQEAMMRAARARTYEECSERTPAAEAFHRGQLALRADHAAKAAIEFQTASELDPANHEYPVMAAFARFCAAADRDAAAVEARKVLERGINKSEHPALARYYLGRVERMLGRERDALRHFREVLVLQPEHAEAASEVRVLEARRVL
jgi:tetratricopeptide (TPR) repeat protein